LKQALEGAVRAAVCGLLFQKMGGAAINNRQATSNICRGIVIGNSIGAFHKARPFPTYGRNNHRKKKWAGSARIFTTMEFCCARVRAGKKKKKPGDRRGLCLTKISFSIGFFISRKAGLRSDWREAAAEDLSRASHCSCGMMFALAQPCMKASRRLRQRRQSRRQAGPAIAGSPLLDRLFRTDSKPRPGRAFWGANADLV